MKTKPTPEQVAAEIAKLKAMKPNVRHHSVFGEDHHAAIDGQIEVLDQDLSSDDICDAHDNAMEDEPWHHENELNAGLEARGWLDGEENMAPSQNWESLLVSK